MRTLHLLETYGIGTLSYKLAPRSLKSLQKVGKYCISLAFKCIGNLELSTTQHTCNPNAQIQHGKMLVSTIYKSLVCLAEHAC